MPHPTNLLQDPRTAVFPTPPTVHSPATPLKSTVEDVSRNNQSTKGGEEIGHALMSEHVVYEMNKETSKFKELEVTPITLYSSEYSYLSGNLIGVNKSYICYTVRGDMVRVLNRKSASRGLLKGHTSSIQDIQFQDEDSDILITCAKDSTFYIWKLDTQDSSTIGHQILFSKNTGEGSLIRAQWNTISKEYVAIAKSTGLIYIVNISDNNIIELTIPNTIIKDISFSTSDVSIIGIATDQDVQFWNWKSKQLVKNYLPHENKLLTSIVFVPTSGNSNNSSYLLTGANNNNELKLWNLKTQQCIQSINFANETHSDHHNTKVWNKISFDPTGNYLLVTNTKEKNICVLHLSRSKNKISRFDYLAEFSLAYPIISFMVTNIENELTPSSLSSSSPTTTSSIQMQMFCVQTKAIQLYHINSANCHPSLDTLEEEAETVEQQQPQEEEEHVTRVEATKEEETNEASQTHPKEEEEERESEEAVTKVEAEEDNEGFNLNSGESASIVNTSISDTEADQQQQQHSTIDTNNNVVGAPGTSEEELLTPLSFASIMNEEETSTIEESTEEESHISTDDFNKKKENKKSPGKNKNRKKNKTPSVSSILARPPPGTIVPDSHLSLLPVSPDTHDTSVPSSSSSLPPLENIPHNSHKKKDKIIKEEPEEDFSSIGVSSNVDINILMATLKKMEHSITSKNEKLLTSQMDKLYSKIEKEKQERDRLEKERLEKLFSYITSTIHTNMPQQLESIIHKELQNVIVPAIAKSLVQTLENNLLKPLQENIKKMLSQSFAPKIESIVKDSISKVVMNKQISSDLSKAVTSNMKAPIQEAFSSVFQETLVPSIENSTQVMFRQIANAFEKGLQEKLLPSDNNVDVRKMEALQQQIKYSIDNLNELSVNLTKNMIDTQTKLFNDLADKLTTSTKLTSSNSNEQQQQQQQQQQASRPQAANPPQQQALTANHLNKLIQENKFDEAFSAVTFNKVNYNTNLS